MTTWTKTRHGNWRVRYHDDNDIERGRTFKSKSDLIRWFAKRRLIHGR